MTPQSTSGTTIVRAGSLIDGTGAEPRRGVVLTVEDGIITRVDDAGALPRGPVLDLGEYTVLPGLINMHTHTVLPGDGTPFAEWMELPDELLLLQAHRNVLTALETGVTTIRDCGGKGVLTFRLRDAIRKGIVAGPRLVLSGRPLTITGGHCRYFGGEVDGPEEMRHAARQLLKEGADFIKIMASGGGTVGTYSQFPSFDVDEMRAAIHEAHKIGKRASCHCIATESITNALAAGTDHIEHCSFMAPDTSQQYDEQVAHRVVEAGVVVTPTLQVMAEGKMARGNLANVRHLHELGVPIVAGNDAGWRTTGFGDFYKELELLAACGLTPLEAIHAATGGAADACQLGGITGTLAVGCTADLLAVRDDPLTRLDALASPALVMQFGQIVVDRR
jgi:imidazolonepropionase-like amidohydrolase